MSLLLGRRPTWVRVHVWPFPVPVRLDMGTVGQLARWQLAAKRVGVFVRFVELPPALVELIDLAGLRTVLLGP